MRKTVAMQRAIAIFGPTASGKSALALSFAEAVGGEIVACDAQMVYRGFDVGTNKPSADEQARVPHHMLDVCAANDEMQAARYGDAALAVVAALNARGKVPVIVVGTYLYYRALVHGLGPLPKSDPAVREEIVRMGPDAIAEEVRRVDPESYEEAKGKNLPRLVRALEVFRITGQKASALKKEHAFAEKRLDVAGVALRPDRDALKQRIDARVLAMWNNGWRDEVRSLLAAGVREDARAMQAVGYRDIAEHLRTGEREAAVIAKIQAATRQYARRQLSFMRQESSAEVFAGFGEEAIRAGIARRR